MGLFFSPRKRKERPNSEPDDAKPNPLIPTNGDSSVTDVLAMDCEMVGVGQGNKIALGRVTLALLLTHPKKDLRDTSDGEGHRKALRHLAAEVLGVEIQKGKHCPVDDARAAMLFYSKNRKEWEKSAKDQIRLKEKQKKRKQRKKLKSDIKPCSNCNLMAACRLIVGLHIPESSVGSPS